MQVIDACPLITLIPATIDSQTDQYPDNRASELLLSSVEVVALLRLFSVAHTAVAIGREEALCDLEEVLESLADLEAEMRELLV